MVRCYQSNGAGGSFVSSTNGAGGASFFILLAKFPNDILFATFLTGLSKTLNLRNPFHNPSQSQWASVFTATCQYEGVTQNTHFKLLYCPPPPFFYHLYFRAPRAARTEERGNK